MNFNELFGRLIGLERAQRIEGVELTWAAPWAQGSAAWLFFGCLALAALAAVFYLRWQGSRSSTSRVVLAVIRAGVLCVLLLFLAEPVFKIDAATLTRPVLWLLFDGSESMSIADELSETEREQTAKAVGLADPSPDALPLSRMDYVKALMLKDDGAFVRRLAEDFRLRVFVFDQADGVRALDLAEGADGRIDVAHFSEQLSAQGRVTAIGSALADLGRRHATAHLAGLVVFSDFDNNYGPSPVAAAKELGAPMFAVGVGAATAVDAALSVQSPPHIKKDERGNVAVTVRQQGLDGQSITVSLSAQRLGGDGSHGEEPVPIDSKTIELTGPSQTVEFAFTPDRAGRYVLIAEVDVVPGEIVKENNRAQREITVLDDFLRLMFVEYEPTWEWRFIKEVFHRDKLVGVQGFRTFLRSSDPRVRQANEMFLPTMSLRREDFFANDVIFLGDMPSSALSPRFCQMVDEFVRNFGGGLVVISGPRFGPGQLAETPLANLLPVKLDPSARISDRQPFRLVLSPRSEQYGFMQIAGAGLQENQKAWDNMGLLPWFQPVERLHPMGVALAEHPTAKCADGRTAQPMIAIRRAGRGEVVFLAMNETWRLRRLHGELYYRAFYGQLIHRLGLSHELGSQKRFVVHTDRRRYQPEEDVLVTVEAYNAQFEPLSEKDLPDQRLKAELILPDRAAGEQVQPLTLTQVREGEFESRFPVFAPGEHRVRVFDPVAERWVETTFPVAQLSVERLSAVRNVDLQRQLADARPGGRSYELAEVDRLLEDLRLTPRTETQSVNMPLWNTWLAFVLVVSLLLGEWLLRKWVNLP